eukprot:3998942-Pyramimonas_sp.AAC.1
MSWPPGRLWTPRRPKNLSFLESSSWGSSLDCLRASGGCLGPLGALAGPFGHPPDRFGPVA